VRTYWGGRFCADEHAIHGNILAAGNQVVPGMDKIHPEVHWDTLDNSSVACCHQLSPNVKVFYNLKNSLGISVSFLQS
jgi:hypothetical protein